MRQIMAFQGHIALIAYLLRFFLRFMGNYGIAERFSLFDEKGGFVPDACFNMRASHAKTLQGRWYKKTGDARRLRFGLFA